MMIICAKLLLNPTMYNKVLQVSLSKQIGTYGVSVWVSLIYFKWDLFRRHIKNGLMWLKFGLSCYFFVWGRHISIQMLGRPKSML